MSNSGSDKGGYGRKQRLLLRAERFSRHHYKVVFLVALLLVGVTAWLGSRLHLESDFLALFPEGNGRVDTFREALTDFGSIDYLLAVVEIGDDSSLEDMEDFADIFADRLREETSRLEHVEYRLELDERFLELFYRNALLFLPPERLPELAEKLATDRILAKIQEDRLHLSSPTAGLSEDLLLNDPLGLTPLFLNRILGNRGALNVDLSDGYYLSSDGLNLIMLLKPTGSSHDLAFNRELLDMVQRVERESREELEGELEGELLPLTVSYGGNYALALQETRLIRKDLKRNIWISLLAVSLLYWICYRRFAALLYSSVPLLVGQALTFGLAYFVLKELNAASSAFTALLMGLGADFTIVMYARYVEERRRGLTLARATEAMVGETGLGVFTGAITSAGTFYALCISRFRGLFDLGFLIGSGILLCAFAIVFLMPAMITWNEGVRKRKVESIKKLHLQSFGLERLIPFSVRHRVPVIVIVTLLAVVSAWLGTRLTFNNSINALRSNRTDAAQVQSRIAETFGASLSYMMAIAEADSEQEAMALTAAIRQRLEPFLADGTIGSEDSILTYLPPVEQQEQVLAALRNDQTGEFDPARIRTAFIRGLRENGFREDVFQQYLSRMQSFLTPERPVRLQDLVDQGLNRLVDRYVLLDEGKVKIVTYLFPTDKRWKRDPPPGLIEALAGDDPGIVVTGTNVLAAELRAIFAREAPRAVIVGLVLVFILLILDFRSLRLSFVAMAQLVAGVSMMFGVMWVLDLELNFVNSFVAAMILGVGIDYSIHLVHRMHHSGDVVSEGLLETGKAVVIAAMINIAGFGTLMLGSYPALRTLGLVAVIGSMTCLATALTLVPALMAGRRRT
jgi:predicted RND superfamily exporter protein